MNYEKYEWHELGKAQDIFICDTSFVFYIQIGGDDPI